MNATAEAAPARPGRSRSQACDDAILAATLDVLGESGYGGMTMSMVIERAGVSSATLYRRWTTKLELVTAAVMTLVPTPPDFDTGSLEGDLEALVGDVAAGLDGRRQDVAEVFAAEKTRRPDLAAMVQERFVEPRIREVEHLLARAKARGEITKALPAEHVLSVLVGPLHHRAFSLGKTLTPAFRRSVVAATAGFLTAP